jgi:hypothetical protein
VGVLITSAALTACSGAGTEAPPPPPACQTSNTADVAFRNNNARNVYQILWNGAVIGTLPPGRTGLNRTVPAGTPHTLTFRIANTTTNACAPSGAVLTQCTSTVFSCAG